MNNENQDWQSLARLAAEEQDPEKLIDLVRQLNSALEKSDGGLGFPTIDSSTDGPVGSSLPNPDPGKIADAAA